MPVKYQIFISSTYDDLKVERDQVLKAVLEMGHIPVGMEMFSAADEEQWRLIARQIDESDYYVVIIAHRYGSVVDGISYTEKEYDYAVQRGVPVLGFMIDESAAWPADRFEADRTKQKPLEAFKDKLRRKQIGTWKTSDELHAKVSISLMKAFTAYPRTGWVQASSVLGPEVLREVSRLSAENSELRKALHAAEYQAADDIEHRRRETLAILGKNTVIIPLAFQGEKDWPTPVATTMLRIFFIVAPTLIPEKPVTEIGRLLAVMLAKDKKEPRYQWPIPLNSLESLLADLLALDLVEPSAQRHSVKDTEQYWSLSSEGKEVYKMLRIERLRRGDAPATGETGESPNGPRNDASGGG